MSTTPPSRPLADIITPRRLVTTALLLLAAVLTVVGLQATANPPAAAACGSPIGPLIKYLPCPGSSTPRQDQLGVVLAPGYSVDLFLDGAPIPKDQVQQEGEVFEYQPGPGTATGVIGPGRHTLKAVYYLTVAGEATGVPTSWVFTAT